METPLKEIKISLPSDILLSANINQEEIVQEMLETLAYKYFAKGRLSGGKAARLAGMSRVAFLSNAYRHNIEWLSYSPEDVRREL
jgi:predicted HTH domain antitoxin